MTLQNATDRVVAAGWGGVCIWTQGGTSGGDYMGCLLKGMVPEVTENSSQTTRPIAFTGR